MESLTPQYREGSLYLTLGDTFIKTFQSSIEAMHVSLLVDLYSIIIRGQGVYLCPWVLTGKKSANTPQIYQWNWGW